MDIANSFAPNVQGYTCPDAIRHNSKALAELDNGDFLTIDDLLDFSNDDIGGPIEPCHSNAVSSANPPEAKFSSCSTIERNHCQVSSVFDADGPGELCVPCDDLAELEWLSNFVEESFSSGDVQSNVFCVRPAGTENEKTHRGIKEPFQSASPVSVLESSACSGKPGVSFTPEMSVPGRARSKRCRTAVCFWNTRILSSDAAASILETSSTSTVTVSDPQSSDSDTFAYEQGGADSFPAMKLYKSTQSKIKKMQDPAQSRRCLHCATQRTPQWRAGPMGPKTLCNACGVRYKSGRLLPEYRPAASPTFIESVHSNSHRRVLEMRRQRDTELTVGHEHQLQFDDGCLLNEEN